MALGRTKRCGGGRVEGDVEMNAALGCRLKIEDGRLKEVGQILESSEISVFIRDNDLMQVGGFVESADGVKCLLTRRVKFQGGGEVDLGYTESCRTEGVE